MKTKAIRTWQDVDLTDLFFAFRKAKADCFFERSICIAREFANYEHDLAQRLTALLARLHQDQVEALLAENLGQRRVVAKKLGTAAKSPKKRTTPDGHGFFSDPIRAFDHLYDSHDLTPEFRLIGDFPVEMHVLSALWINLIGHKFDAALSKSAYGSRLRRYRPEPGAPKGSVGDYHLEAIGSFQPYFGPYKEWRNRGLRAIRTELEAGHAVVAISMDLTSYYHLIDPTFISDSRFLAMAGISLSEWEQNFTRGFTAILVEWSKQVASEMHALGCSKVAVGGLPIGLSLSRVAANALLAGLDHDIEQGLTPVYYGRYVDDLFLVLRDPGHLVSADQVLSYFAARTQSFPSDGRATKGEVYLTLPGEFQGKTKLLLQQSKQKTFFLQGQVGIDLLSNIESQIRSVSSERRLMASPDRLESMASAKVLTAAGHPSEEADTLRRADSLSVRRLGWSIQLRAVETLARDLREDDWRQERKQFYEFAHSHILRPDKILDHLDYLPRLLSLAVALMDWPDAHRLVESTLNALKALQAKTASSEVKVNGFRAKPCAEGRLWDGLLKTTLDLASDALLRSVRWSHSKGAMRPLGKTALDVCEAVGLGKNVESIAAQALGLRETDWAKSAYKDHLRRHAARQRPAVKQEHQLHHIYPHEHDLCDFLKKSVASVNGTGAARVPSRCIDTSEGALTPSLLPYLLPTRPYTAQEVSLFLPEECVFEGLGDAPARNWARYVQAVRGIWVLGSLVQTDLIHNDKDESTKEDKPTPERIARMGGSRAVPKVRLGISSLLTNDESFIAAANGRSDLSRSRYQRIQRLINQAIDAYPRPTHLMLPELSLPERWIDTVSRLLQEAGISLIAGLDYHRGPSSEAHSEAVLVLADDRLGFPSSVQIRQAKSLPAAGEEETLLRLFGLQWPAHLANERKPVYIHYGFCFGVLICSELQNIAHRQQFQGNVDCMMILSWNQDLETFSALVESASLDVHAHIALVNNRKYGDSRVRNPAKEAFKRDACRLRGGENEHVAVVELEIANLRAFQSREKRWPREDDPYKPVPEGFAVAKFRKTIPR
ncbi:RNA-directed DNA polymerase [Ectothiorhodospira lacustris]|uniref:RNA-directed DNA polymerase n=1 Tax=Ectothiorhodospira lacustris TaxID=2899127 RepID=UPI001EE79CA6|nr:RNA-directed DNA polymerase [Ectothiorhodospira lacustris]MCG5509014.1 RNA-directed DNA polymerase [Ectothiorhodospira lacustris]MCG5520805.1 RNA-directed DNA polymerase [Ectothiorhodospira lacustris]